MIRAQEVFHRAVECLKKGDYESALNDFVWLHDNPDPFDRSSEMFRRAHGFSVWALMGKKYPPATEKMVELLAQKEEYLKIHPDDMFVRADAGAMQQALAFNESR